jgi:hypothetical protein
VHLLFANFRTVDPHYDNVNIFHAYLERLLGILVDSKQTCKMELAAALVAEEQSNSILDLLFSHTHKLSAEVCLELMFKVDFENHLALTPVELKTKIISKAFEVITAYREGTSLESE